MVNRDNDELDVIEKNPHISDEHDEKAQSGITCPVGKHSVRTHQLHVPPSKNHSEGMITTRHEHCAENPSHGNDLSQKEIQQITEDHFSDLVGPPTSGVLTKVFKKADNYDKEIRGWVQYWNDIFNLDDPLDPNFIKALIATESSFEPHPKKYKTAHGLMQITDSTFSILDDKKGELKSHRIRITKNDLFDPSINICVGVRWLFQKKKLVGIRLKRESTWEEAVIEYKGYWSQIKKGNKLKAMEDLHKYYNMLREE